MPENLTLDLHDLMQWGALWAMVLGIMWRFRQHKEIVEREARRQERVELSLKSLDARMTRHEADDQGTAARLNDLCKVMSDVREWIVRIETMVKH